MYLPMLNFTAVLAFPNKSYPIPNRGETLNQSTTSSTLSKCRGPTKRPAGASCTSTNSFSHSNLTPPCTVRRLTVHESWT